MGKAVVATELAASAPLGAAPATGHGSPSRIALRSPWLFFEQLSAGERRRIFTLTPSSPSCWLPSWKKVRVHNQASSRCSNGLSWSTRMEGYRTISDSNQSRSSLMPRSLNGAGASLMKLATRANDTAQGSEDADHVLAGDEDVRLQRIHRRRQ